MTPSLTVLICTHNRAELLGGVLTSSNAVARQFDWQMRILVGATKLRRRYFLRLHWLAGRKFGQFKTLDYIRTWFIISPSMLMQVLKNTGKALVMMRSSTSLRQAINAVQAWGTIHGIKQPLLEGRKNESNHY